MKQWWQQLQQREQILVVVMSVFVGIFMLYQLVWQPVHSGLDKAEKKQARTQELFEYVKINTAQVSGTSTPKKVKATGSLSSVVNRIAGQFQIAISRVQPQGDSVQVWIEEVPFEQLLRWLDNLTHQQGLNVSNIDISSGDKAGIVKVRRLTLTRS